MGSTSAIRSTVEGIEVTPFVTSTGLHVNQDDIDTAGQVKLVKVEGDSVYYRTDENDLTIERFGRMWTVIDANTLDGNDGWGSADFFTLQEARKGAAAIRVANRRLRKEQADFDSRQRGFESSEDEARFTVYGENLANVATKLAATANAQLGLRDLRYEDEINKMHVADKALQYVWMLWNALEAGTEYKAAMASVQENAQRRVLSMARYAADRARRDDLCELGACARVAEGELWGYGYGW